MFRALPARTALLGLSLLVFAAIPASVGAQDQSRTFDQAQEEEIRDIVREYLLQNPEVLIEAINVYRDRQRVAAEQRQQRAVKTLQASLASDPDTPVLGNPEGDVVMVEFFDYNCGYCKSVVESIREVVAQDSGIRLVMKEFPILGPDSQFAARAALAAAKQDRYEEFHFALMAAPGRVDEDQVLRVAHQLGLDIERLRQDMDRPEIDAALRRNFELAEGLEISGTPAFVIGSQVFPGALDETSLRRIVEETRAGAS